MRTFVKVCGLRTIEAIDWAVELGYSAVGFVMHKPSMRFCEPSTFNKLAAYAEGKIYTVAVGISYDEVETIRDRVDFIQLYEYHETERLIFASDKRPDGIKYDYYMYDASRGSGRQGEFPEWLCGMGGRCIISGGLNVGNAGNIVGQFRPFGVDVSSGVESSPGVKSFNKMNEFIREVRHAGG